MRAAAATLAFLLALTFTATSRATPSPTPSGQPEGGPRALGHAVYERHCAICHGPGGDGAGPAAARLNVAPRDFRTGVYKLRSTGSGSLPTDEDLLGTIRRGVPGTSMVPQDHLSETELAAVVDYIKSLSPRFAAATASPKVLVLPSPVPRTPEAIERGAEVYKEAGCQGCHGAGGKGDGPSAKSLSVAPTDFTRRPLKAGDQPAEIVRAVVTGFDGTPMPSFHLFIADADLWALAYYIESLGDAPTRTAEEALGWQIENRTPPATPALEAR